MAFPYLSPLSVKNDIMIPPNQKSSVVHEFYEGFPNSDPTISFVHESVKIEMDPSLSMNILIKLMRMMGLLLLVTLASLLVISAKVAFTYFLKFANQIPNS